MDWMHIRSGSMRRNRRSTHLRSCSTDIQQIPIWACQYSKNTLVKPWPGNPEYEFRDISYSDRHVAVYHGWLPLYAIAASFAVAHITPDQPGKALSIKHDLNECKRITRAARLPAVLFGAAFLAVVFLGANRLYGRDAGWAALILGAIHTYPISLSCQARYYSAQLLFTTLCCVLVWLIVTRGQWRHYVLAGFAFVLLFHTHLLSFFSAVLVVVVVTPLIFRDQKDALPKTLTFGLIVAGGTVPWLLFTGFLVHQAGIPRGWALLRLPADLQEYRPLHLTYLALGMVFAAAVSGVLVAGQRISPRVKSALLDSATPLSLIAVWVACGYTAFILMMPAASFSTEHLNLSYWGPALIGAAVICAATARAIRARISVLASLAVVLALFAASSQLSGFRPNTNFDLWASDVQVIDQLRAMQLPQDARLYAAPNNHLIWTVYAGLPVQSIAPVRREFLNSYRGEIVYIDSPVSQDSEVLSPENLEAAAVRAGYQLSPESAERWLWLLRTRHYREAMLDSVSSGGPAQLEALPRFGEDLVRASETEARAAFAHLGMDAVTRGFRIDDWSDWRAVFFYRFVDPDSRRGTKANYSERLRGAEGVILTRANSAIYRSPWQAPEGRGIRFRFVPELPANAADDHQVP
jgi:hypothetical protein